MTYRRAKNLDKNLIFAEYFNSEQEVRRNGGVPENATFDNGGCTLADNGRIVYEAVSGINNEHGLSLRIKVKDQFNLSGSNEVLMSWSAAIFEMVVSFTATTCYSYIRNPVDQKYYGARHDTLSDINGKKELVVIFGTVSNYNQCKIYADGVLLAATQYNNGAPTSVFSLPKLRFGGATTGSFDSGALDAVEIYNKALTAEEVSNLYNDARYSIPVLERKPYNHLSFNGIDQYAYVADNGSLDVNQASAYFCYTGWFKANKDNLTQYVFGKLSTGTVPGRWGIYINSTNVVTVFLETSTGNISIGTGIDGDADTSEHHYTVKVDLVNSKVYIYVDGVVVVAGGTSYTGTFPSMSNVYEFYLGAGSLSGGATVTDFTRTTIRDVRIYHKDITSQLDELMRGDALGNEIAWWLCNDHSGEIIDQTGSYNLTPVALSSHSYGERTSKILHVNARDGVARNLLSWDVIGGDIPRTWTALLGSPTINGDIITFPQVGVHSVRDLSYWTIGKRYRITASITNAAGSSGIILPYDGSIQVAEDGFSCKKYTNGRWTYDYIPASTQASMYSYNDGGGIITVESIEEVIPEVTNTDVEVVKDGNVRSIFYNAVTTTVDCGNYHDLLGDISILAWIKPSGFGEGGAGRIIDNGQFELFLYNSLIYARSSHSINTTTNISSILEWNQPMFIAMIRAADGTTDIYVDGVLLGADKVGGTPVAGSQNIAVGNRMGGANTFDGKISEVIALEGLLTAEEISQYFSSTKHLYGK